MDHLHHSIMNFLNSLNEQEYDVFTSMFNNDKNVPYCIVEVLKRPYHDGPNLIVHQCLERFTVYPERFILFIENIQTRLNRIKAKNQFIHVKPHDQHKTIESYVHWYLYHCLDTDNRETLVSTILSQDSFCDQYNVDIPSKLPLIIYSINTDKDLLAKVYKRWIHFHPTYLHIRAFINYCNRFSK